MNKILILGGTSEANALARALAGRDVVTSQAGRTKSIPDLPGRMRVGGFGAAAGLADYLRTEGIGAVIDATHPFAARISAHAAEACTDTGIPRLMLVRPMWARTPADRWMEVESMAEAAARLPTIGRRAFLTVGVQEVAAFAGRPEMWFLVRLLEARPLPLADYRVVAGRGPFTAADEEELMRAYGVEVVVTKAAGGDATAAKIAAARALDIPVVMVRRPPPPDGPAVSTVEEAVRWLDGLTSPA